MGTFELIRWSWYGQRKEGLKAVCHVLEAYWSKWTAVCGIAESDVVRGHIQW